ncbi:probable G-protein coupled receptor B0563.6 isoform X1 [Penaeus chinensis]|uniref:probable G-protein coupled receptor B0563.6 isoform X1 n=1 Tax=Penaeus chinensis TaxID=139456 RepID=UPI001FB778D3|nr:probable G-protein coupled receptor B0563.6 isoform X1 [Penaeus chinensis]
MLVSDYPGPRGVGDTLLKGHGNSSVDPRISQTRFVAYSVIAPVIIIVGILGNILTILLLRKPQFRGVTYTYFLALAVSDLLSLFFSISIIVHLVQVATRAYSTAVWYSYFEVLFANAPMSASVLIVVCVTVDRFFSVCRPQDFKGIHTMRNARKGIAGAVVVALLMWLPTCTFKQPLEHDACNTTFFEPPDNGTWWVACMMPTLDQPWYVGYLWTRQTVVSFVPIVALVVMNVLIVKEYVQIRERRRELDADSSRDPAAAEGRRKDDKNLINLLRAVIISFFVTLVPAGVFNSMYSETLSTELEYEIFRAVANDLEILNHALNFYLYIVCSKPIRAAIREHFQVYRRSWEESHVSKALVLLTSDRSGVFSPTSATQADAGAGRGGDGGRFNQSRETALSKGTGPSDFESSSEASHCDDSPAKEIMSASLEDGIQIGHGRPQPSEAGPVTKDLCEAPVIYQRNGSVPKGRSQLQTVVHTVEIHHVRESSPSQWRPGVAVGQVNAAFEDSDASSTGSSNSTLINAPVGASVGNGEARTFPEVLI